MEQAIQKLNGCAQLAKYGQKNNQRKKGMEGERGTKAGGWGGGERERLQVNSPQ